MSNRIECVSASSLSFSFAMPFVIRIRLSLSSCLRQRSPTSGQALGVAEQTSSLNHSLDTADANGNGNGNGNSDGLDGSGNNLYGEPDTTVWANAAALAGLRVRQ